MTEKRRMEAFSRNPALDVPTLTDDNCNMHLRMPVSGFHHLFFFFFWVTAFVPSAHARLLTGYHQSTPHAVAAQPSAGPLSLTSPAFERHPVEEKAGVPPVQAAQQPQPQPQPQPQGTPVDLTADSLSHDRERGIVTAQGNVVLKQNDHTLRADEVIYNLVTEEAVARGDVILEEPGGTVHFSDDVRLNQAMRSGVITSLRSYLATGGQFAAEDGRLEGNRVVMRNASYTPCECDLDEDGDPIWALKAREVTHDKDEKRITYRNARLEVGGVPVAWTPFLSHSDGSIERKSGFLTPEVGFDSQLGPRVAVNYYWDIEPHRDATTGLMVMGSENPVALAGYRHRFKRARIEADGSLTYSGRPDSEAGQTVQRPDEWRGHLFAEGVWDVNDHWRAGFDAELTSDDQYLRQYDFTGTDILENEIYAERFDGRDYAVIRGLAFQDVRVRENRTDQPNVLPEADIKWVGTPNATFGGRWSAGLSALGLEREGDGQDVNRISATAGWMTRSVLPVGLVTTAEATVRGDTYYVRDRELASLEQGRSREVQDARGFGSLHVVTSYPMVKPVRDNGAQIMIEPLAALTIAPSVDSASSKIPNEDSQDVQLDTSNLLNANRFPGFDRIEDDSKIVYGMRTGLYAADSSQLTFFAGQSYRLDDDANPFPEGSGLSRQESDIVGNLSGRLSDRFGLDYRFQLDGAHLSSQRHEVDAFASLDRFRWRTRYLFAKALEGTEISESREQIENAAAYDLTRAWQVRAGALHDLGVNSGLRKAMLGFDYDGCCLLFSVTAERSLTSEASGDSGTDVMFRLGLKGLGTFETAGDDSWGLDN